MIGLDTNVLARYLVQDDRHQGLSAARLMEAKCTRDDPGMIGIIVLCELVWVLDHGYGYDRVTISDTLRRLLSAEDLRVERSELAWRALNLYEGGKADFADYLIGLANQEQKAEPTYTFDRRAADCSLFSLLG